MQRQQTSAIAYARTGTSEQTYVQFVSPSISTIEKYSKYVEIDVSGTGWSSGANINDAFYGVPSGIPNSPYYQLNIGWDNAPLTPFVGESRNIDNYIAFIEGIGPVIPPARPQYSLDNHYHFVVAVPETATHLQFGVSDGNFSDNGGAYHIQVWQVAESTALGGSLTGMNANKGGKAVCKNLNTKQQVTVVIPKNTDTRNWDCSSIGLIVNQGDQIKQTVTITGTAD